MTTDHTPNIAVQVTKLASLAAILAIVVGAMVLVGWAFDIAVLKSILPGWVAMKANAAACFILIGIALLLVARPPATFNPRISTFFARLCGLLAGLIGLLTLGEYIFGWNPGIDQWLFREPDGALGTSNPGRMASETALCFVLLAAALWITGSLRHIRKSTRARWAILASVNLGLLVTTLALAAMLSYLTPILGPHGWFGLTIMAMHTSVLFAMLGMAVIAISWQQDVLPWSLGRNTTVALACGMALLVFIGLSINRSQFWLGETNLKIAHTEKMLIDADNIQIEIIEAQVHSRDYLLTGDEQFLKRYLSAKADSNMKLDELRRTEFALGEPEHQQHFTQIEAIAEAQFQWLQQVIDARRTGMNEAAFSNILIHGEGRLDKFRSTLDQNKNEDRQIIEHLKREAESVARFSYITIATGTFASLLIFLAVIFRLNSAVNERMQKELALQESEEKFRKITESAQDAIIMMGTDQRISFWNAAATRVFGYTAAEAIGQELHTLIVPTPAHAGFAQAFPHFQETGGGPIIGKVRELTALRKGGEEFTVELSVSATQLSGQWHAIGIVRDITERKRNEDALNSLTGKLRDSKQLLEAIVEHIPIMVFVKRASDLCFEMFNRAGEKLLGYSRSDLLGKGNYDFWPKDQGDWFTAADRKVLASHEVTEIMEEPIKTASGETRYLHTWKVGLRDASGDPAHLLGISIDITERKLAEAQLTEQLDELRRWHDATSGREGRILDLKHEVNKLLAQAGRPPRYPSAEAIDETEK